MSRKAFTLVELLVAIAIIAVLITLLVPSLSGATRKARQVACLNQMRNLGFALTEYARENGDVIPRSSHSALAYQAKPWGYALAPQVARGFIYNGPGQAWDAVLNGPYRCPADSRRDSTWSYGKSVWTELERDEIIDAIHKPPSVSSFGRIGNIPWPAVTIIFGEIKSGAMADHAMAHCWYIGGEPEVDKLRHGNDSDYVYLDGHVAAVKFELTFDKKKSLDNWNPDTAR